MFSEERVFDEPNWGGTFDTNDDIDSAWGFNASSKEVCKLLRVKYCFSKIISFEEHIYLNFSCYIHLSAPMLVV